MRVGMGLTRDQEIDYAMERGIDIPVTHASPYSVDVNLWGRSIETGVLEDPWVAAAGRRLRLDRRSRRRAAAGRARPRLPRRRAREHRRRRTSGRSSSSSS